MGARTPLTDDEISGRLAGRPGWGRDGGTISRTFTGTWDGCVALAVAVAAKANELDHHPDIDIRWQRVRFAISTHSAGGLTALDFELAEWVDALAAAAGAGSISELHKPVI